MNFKDTKTVTWSATSSEGKEKTGKGPWTTDGCKATGKNGIAFKRATKDFYALVALNGGATFTDCPAGTYTDVVTGKTYTGSTIEVEAPSTQGQLRRCV